MNALALAAFGMLLWNPNWIGDLSFLLSFLAVAGILLWGVPLCRRCRTRHRWLNAVSDAYVIGLTATLATAPLVSHTFGIVPLAGLVVNPVAILLAGVVVFGGALWMLLPVGWLAPLFGLVTGKGRRSGQLPGPGDRRTARRHNRLYARKGSHHPPLCGFPPCNARRRMPGNRKKAYLCVRKTNAFAP